MTPLRRVGKLAIGRGAVKLLLIEDLEVGRLRLERLEVAERERAVDEAASPSW